MSIYDKNFYEYINDGAVRSANKIVPKVLEIFKADSVIDFGCGTGAWLSTFKKYGSKIILGLDSSPDGHQMIDEENFELIDLSLEYRTSFKYDLAMSLEVAEHLDISSADTFVSNLVNSSDNILWSAAVPGQRGLNHINEQWPSYWVEKFASYGYKCNGSFRYDFWFDEDIDTWYRQNILLFSKNINWNEKVRDLIHYNNYSNYNTIEDKYVF